MTVLLKADTSHWEADKAVKAYYAELEGLDDMLWLSSDGVSVQADSLLSYLRREVPRNGLDTAAFFLPQIASDLDVVRNLTFDSVGVSINEVLPRLDYNLSKAYVRYTAGMRGGFVRPDKLFNRLDYKANGDGFARLFDYEVKSPDYKTALSRLQNAATRHDYLQESKPDFWLYRVLQERLEKTTDKDARRKLAVNMERCRWQMKHPDETECMILVNIPSLQLWAVCPDSVVNMRICCGATTTKTPLLHSAISYMQVNPEWIIPQNIVKTDIARHAGDSAYFARHNYFVTQRATGDTLNPAEITSDQLNAGVLRVGQKGGAGNSLGRIVFRFPNNFSVYLHDTNNRGAFNSERRTLSHGCVRVQKPFELACFLLPDANDWKLDCLRISMDMKPETDRGMRYLREHEEDPRPFRLMTYHDVSPRVPIYIVYYTAYPNPESGVLETFPDLYGYDKAIGREMKAFLP